MDVFNGTLMLIMAGLLAAEGHDGGEIKLSRFYAYGLAVVLFLQGLRLLSAP